MSKKQVLIVDDAKDILFLLMHSVKRLGPEYEATTATDGPTALNLLQKQKFDLVIADYMMPNMTGLELAHKVNEISPGTQILLMTAYDTTSLREMVENLEISGYIGKPFTVPQVLEMIEHILARTSKTADVAPVELPTADQTVYEHLKTLYHKIGAHDVLLLNSEGQPIQVIGQADQTTISRLATFVASNFLAVTELASLIGDNTSVFKSSYHEGSNYNIYALDVNREHLLAVVFGTEGRPGAVWFYTKQTADALVVLLGDATQATTTDDQSAAIAADFDSLLGGEENSVN